MGQLVEEVAAAQRDILRKVYNTSDVSHIPQLWVMYKEVQGYFQDGVSFPFRLMRYHSDPAAQHP